MGKPVVSTLSSLHRRIGVILDAAILNRTLEPGAILLEAVIAEALSTSRTPVKAALERLRADSRVEKRNGRGYVVLDEDGATPSKTFRPDRDSYLALTSAAQLGGRTSSAWSRIYHEVEAQVATGALYGRLRIVEGELAKNFDVSRTVARDVLSRIEKVGLVVKDERGHWRVLALTPERTRNIYELRRALEPLALRRVAELGRHGGAADMRDRLAAARERLPYVAPWEVCAFERELHVDLLGACGNPEIVKALRIGQLQIAANDQLLGELALHFPQILREHLDIADRLAADDISGASDALAAHLDGSKSEIIDRIATSTATTRPSFPRYLSTN